MDGLRHRRRRRRSVGPTGPDGSTDALLLVQLARTFADAAALAGQRLVCRPGCSECCAGPFPITRLDATRLRDGLQNAERQDPERTRRIQARARDAVSLLKPGYPGDPDTGKPVADEAALDRFFQGHASLPCPVLDPGSGRCELYEHRPVACRTYGPPLRHGDRDAPHCPLCFVGAPQAEVDRCRVEPDRDGIEAKLLAQLGVERGDEWETLIAFAVAK